MTNVLMLYECFIPSVRLCGYEQLSYIAKSKQINFQHCEVSRITKEQIRNCDVVIMVRNSSSQAEVLAGFFKKANKYLVYVLDDDLLNVPLGLSSSWYFQLEEVKRSIKKIMSLSDCLLSPSQRILDKYGDKFNRIGLIEEPSLPYECSMKEKSQKVKIGFAGSIDRCKDIDILLTDVIETILEKYKERVSFEFFGAKPKLIETKGLTYYPYEDTYEEYKKKMWELNWHIGLAPMPDSDFHQYKHYNKYIEYSSLEIIGIYSNVYPYTEVIKDGLNGFLCDNNKAAWVKTISYCIDEYDKLVSMLQNIRNQALDKFSIEKTAEMYIRAVPQILDYHSDKNKLWIGSYYLKYLQINIFIKKSFLFVKRNRAKSLIVLLKRIRDYLHR